MFTNIQSDCSITGFGDNGTSNLSDIEGNINVTIYPNPAKESVTIEGVGEINIFNSFGQLVYRKANNNITTVDVSNFEKGIYFIKVGDILKKLVVQ